MTIFEEIIEWNKSRNNTDFDELNEHRMLCEEIDEMFQGIRESDENAIVDALCDVIVISVGALYKMGYSPNEAMLETLKEINSRKQDPDQENIWKKWGAAGKWQKWREQPQDTLYKADYTKAKL